MGMGSLKTTMAFLLEETITEFWRFEPPLFRLKIVMNELWRFVHVHVFLANTQSFYLHRYVNKNQYKDWNFNSKVSGLILGNINLHSYFLSSMSSKTWTSLIALSNLYPHCYFTILKPGTYYFLLSLNFSAVIQKRRGKRGLFSWYKAF